jgi:hypothetical protein
MSNDNNSGIRENIHINNYDHKFLIITESPYTPSPFDQQVFYTGNGMNAVDVINNAFDRVDLLYAMRAFLEEYMQIEPVAMSEERMMEIAQHESLNHYKTQEKKPYIKLCIESKIVDKSMENNSCTICVSKFEVGENITELECKHTLHTDCIAEWVKYKSNCPVCRAAILTLDETPK